MRSSEADKTQCFIWIPEEEDGTGERGTCKCELSRAATTATPTDEPLSCLPSAERRHVRVTVSACIVGVVRIQPQV